MIKVICYDCNTEVLMKEFEIVYVDADIYHKKWKGVCMSSHKNEYIDFTRTFVRIVQLDSQEETELIE